MNGSGGESPLVFFLLVLKATLLSTGGTGNLPMLHEDLVTSRGWITGQRMAEAAGIGQIAPGPTGLWVVSLGYFVDGVRGGVLAALAVALPPFLVLVLLRLYRRAEKHPAIEGFVRGLGLAVTGVGAVVLVKLLASSGGGIHLNSVLLAAFGAGLMATRRVPVPVLLILAGVVGALLR